MENPRRPLPGEFEIGDEPDLVFDLDEDLVEEGVDLERISGGHALRRSTDHLDVSDDNRVTVDFLSHEGETGLYVAVRVKRDGVPVRPEPLGLIYARSEEFARTLSRARWGLARTDVLIFPRSWLFACIDAVALARFDVRNQPS
jgi:hypothetical protein